MIGASLGLAPIVSRPSVTLVYGLWSVVNFKFTMAMDVPSSTAIVPTQGQLQRQLSQQFQRLYREQLNHTPGKIACQITDEKVMLVIEDSVTKPEQLLVETGESELAEQVRDDLSTALRPQIVELIEGALDREVVDILTDATLATGRTSIVVILSSPPDLRPSAKD
jgi:uncharacterized protein YbcI